MYDKCSDCEYGDVENLRLENEQLKKQYCERTDCTGRIGNSKKVEKLISENEQLKKQQQDFINFLEKNWEETQDIWYIKILNYYKKIIGIKE